MLELSGQLFFLGRIELAVGQFLLEFLERLGGLLKIALGKGLGQLVGGAVLDVLDLFHLPLQRLAPAAKLLSPLVQLAGKVVEFDEGLFTLRLGLDLFRPFFQPLEKFRGVFQSFFFRLLAALGQLLPQVVGRLLYFQRRLRGGRLRARRLRFLPGRKEDHDRRQQQRRQQRQEEMPRRTDREFLQHGNPPQAGVGVGNQGPAGHGLAVGGVHRQGAGDAFLQPKAMIDLQSGLQCGRDGQEGPGDRRDQPRREKTGKPLPVDDAQGIEPCRGQHDCGHQQRGEPAPAQNAQEALKGQAALDPPDFFEKVVHGTLRRRVCGGIARSTEDIIPQL